MGYNIGTGGEQFVHYRDSCKCQLLEVPLYDQYSAKSFVQKLFNVVYL